MGKGPRIQVHIETLALPGRLAGTPGALNEALQRELTRLLAEQGLPLPAGGGPIHLPHERARGSAATPAAAGAEVARTVYRALNPRK